MATLNQKIVANRIIEKVRKGKKVSVSSAMAGIYAPSVAKIPGKLTKSLGFRKLLKEAGINDDVRMKKHAELLHSSHVEFQDFDATKVKRKWVHVSDQEIKKVIEGTKENPTGCKVVTITQANKYKHVIYRAPNQVVQAKILEMQHKLFGDFAPEKLEVITDELTPEEEEFLLTLNGKK